MNRARPTIPQVDTAGVPSTAVVAARQKPPVRGYEPLVRDPASCRTMVSESPYAPPVLVVAPPLSIVEWLIA